MKFEIKGRIGPSGKVMISLYTPPSQEVCRERTSVLETTSEVDIEIARGWRATQQRTETNELTPSFPGIPTSHSNKFKDPSAAFDGFA